MTTQSSSVFLEQPRDQSYQSFGWSLAIHLVAAAALLWFAGHPSAPEPYDLSHVNWVQVLPKTQPNPQSEDRSRRIVQTQTGHLVQKAPTDAYLGEKNQEVDRQTVSRHQLVQTGHSQAQPKAQPVAQAQPKTPSTQASEEAKSAAPLATLGVPMFPKLGATQPQAPQPRRDAFDASVGTGTPQDYIRGLKESESTALNTREFMFYSYFQRIRERLDYAWNRTLQDRLGRMFRSGRYLASDREHTTKVLVTLNGVGQITQVQVVEDSGTRDLDDVAVKSFNDAGPFPNPPRGMISSTGTIQIRWDFVLRT